MTTPVSHHFLLVGLPSTGKTSFLAALWYMVNQPDIECALRLDRLQGDLKYLNQIRAAWLAYQPVPRTGMDSESVVSMLLRHHDTGKTLELSFPDLSGESFRLQWTARQFTENYDNLLKNASGALLFVHPETITRPYRIDTVNTLVIAAGGETLSSGDLVPSRPWDIEKAPTQVQLVELLQFITHRDYFPSPFRLAIVVSAWDILPDQCQLPHDWITQEMPLLQQFLASNRDVFEISFYGLSAQGGRYGLQSDEGHLELQRKPPARRASIIGSNVQNPHDVTEPLQWLMR